MRGTLSEHQGMVAIWLDFFAEEDEDGPLGWYDHDFSESTGGGSKEEIGHLLSLFSQNQSFRKDAVHAAKRLGIHSAQSAFLLYDHQFSGTPGPFEDGYFLGNFDLSRQGDDEEEMALAASEQLSALINEGKCKETFTVYGRSIGNAGAKLLAQSSAIEQAKAIELINCDIETEGARAISESPHFRHVEVLKLASNQIGDDGLTALASSTWLGHLRELHLSGNEVWVNGVEALVNAPWFKNIEVLDFDSNYRMDTPMPAAMLLVKAGAMTKNEAVAAVEAGRVTVGSTQTVATPKTLLVLDIDQVRLDGKRLKPYFIPDIPSALAKARGELALRELNLRNCGSRDIGVIRLLESDVLKQIEKLHLGANNLLTVETMMAFLDAEHIRKLKWLCLDDINMGTEGARSIAFAAHLQNLEYLSLQGTMIGDEGATHLALSKVFKHLKELRLDRAEVGSKGLMAIAESAEMTMLERFSSFGDNSDISEAIEAICASANLKQLKSLSLPNYAMPKDALQMLIDTVQLPALETLVIDKTKHPKLEKALAEKYKQAHFV